MLIVIDLSKKMVGLNLFESFLYTLKNDGKLLFVNNLYTIDNLEFNYNDLKNDIQNILYEHHANSFSICVLYDMDQQAINPLKYSIATNIYNIKKEVINPLSIDYIFNKLYYISLDSVLRDYNYVLIDDNVKVANSIDSYGYVEQDVNSDFLDVLFTRNEFEMIDHSWNEIRNFRFSNEYKNSEKIDELDIRMNKFIDMVGNLIYSKVELVREKYSEFNWYGDKLIDVYELVLSDFRRMLYKDNGLFNLINAPSELIKNALKMEISTYSDSDVIIIRMDMNNRDLSYNREVSRYRYQLEIIAILIYLATNDTRLVFEENKSIDRENHWEIKVLFNEDNLYKMISFYNLKLNMELSKIGKFINNEIEYTEFLPRSLNLSMEMKKPEVPVMPVFQVFPNKVDTKIIQGFSRNLYDRYVKGVEYANKRILDLTAKLRLQKEAGCAGKNKRGSIIELNALIVKMKKEIKGLEQKIAFYRPVDLNVVDEDEKIKYDMIVKEIEELMALRINRVFFIKNLILVLLVSLCLISFIQLSNLPLKMFSLLISMLVISLGIYIVLLFKYLIDVKNKINKKVANLVLDNEEKINELFCNDNACAMYIQNIYNLIMLKKYVRDCELKVIDENNKFKQYNYHYDKLKEHIEISGKIIQLLNIKECVIENIKVDKISDLNIEKNYDKNSLYCPLSYLSILDMIDNKVIVNDEKNLILNSKLIGFVDKIIIKYDKEYEHE